MTDLVESHVEVKGRAGVVKKDNASWIDGNGDFGENGAFVADGRVDANGVGQTSGERGGEVKVIGTGDEESIGGNELSSFGTLVGGGVVAGIETKVRAEMMVEGVGRIEGVVSEDEGERAALAVFEGRVLNDELVERRIVGDEEAQTDGGRAETVL